MALGKIGTADSLAPARSLFEMIEEKRESGKMTVPFSDYLSQAMNTTNSLLAESEKLADEFAAGKTDNILQVVLAAEKADVALQFTMQIRNKILDAYNEIMRMQI